ncbi:putative polyketide synthase 38 [Frankliniella fusca]|uniref:Polyketide synthase 38 n=1 Tax=Frankliniella fusca TaxID=407009 RepID=A0AAE1LMH0_9NEOP|nr:putative polyketide synthase 38 [Frankliniella fusca]KAK3931467.1 putative polyketide synthase 38 [Frankliniella fusca]
MFDYALPDKRLLSKLLECFETIRECWEEGYNSIKASQCYKSSVSGCHFLPDCNCLVDGNFCKLEFYSDSKLTVKSDFKISTT